MTFHEAVPKIISGGKGWREKWLVFDGSIPFVITHGIIHNMEIKCGPFFIGSGTEPLKSWIPTEEDRAATDWCITTITHEW